MHLEGCWDLVTRRVSNRLVCLRHNRENDWSPTECRQVLREAQGTLHSTATVDRRKMEGDEQYGTAAPLAINTICNIGSPVLHSKVARWLNVHCGFPQEAGT
jgi:hypothetical protein